MDDDLEQTKSGASGRDADGWEQPPYRETLQQEAIYVHDRLKTLGVVVAPGSRFDEYYRVLALGDKDYFSPTDPEFELVLHARLDTSLMRFVLEWAPDPCNGAWLEKLQASTLDPPIREAEGANTPHGRNTQYELYCAAILRKANAFECFAEPDVIGHSNGFRFGIACKRLTNPNNLENRIRDAKHQIICSKLPGVICLDLTAALNRENAVIGTDFPEDRLESRMSAAMHGLADTYVPQIEKWADSTWVRGLVLHFHMQRCRADREWGIFSPTMNIALARRNESRRKDFWRICEILDRSLPTSARKSPLPELTERIDAWRFFRNAKRTRWGARA